MARLVRHDLMLTTARLGHLAAPGTVRWPTSRSNRPSYNSFTEEVVQDMELDGVPSPSVPSLFRQTLISTIKRREPMRSESPVQRHSRRSPTGTNSSSSTSAERALLTLQCQQQGRQYEATYHDRNMIACSAR